MLIRILLVLACLLPLLPVGAASPPNPADTVRLAALHRRSEVARDEDPAQSRRLAEEGYRLAMGAGQERWAVRFLLSRSRVLIALGDYPAAQRLCGAAWQRARALADWSLAANALNQMADVVTFQGDTVAGTRLYQEAIAAARRGGPAARRDLVKIQHNLAMQEFSQPGGTVRALRLLEELIAEGRRDSSLRPMMGQMMGNLVHMYRLLHQPAKALDIGRKGLVWTRAAHQPDHETHILTAMAWTLADERRFAEALPLAQQSYARSHHPAVAVERRTDAFEQLTRIEAGLGHWRAAFEKQAEARAMLDSVRSVESVRTTAAQNARFATERKEAHIRELTQAQRAARAELTAQAARNRLLLTAVGGLLLALVVFGLLYRQLRRQRQQLLTSETALRQANATKDQLMGIIGHDLKSPMVSFQQVGPLLRALADDPEPTELREIAAEVDDRARQVSALLDNLLHWARAQAGQVTSRPQVLRLTEVVEPVITLFEPLADAKRVTLRSVVGAEAPPCRADPNLLATVLRNLVSNAIKFTPAGGQVTLAVGRIGGEVGFRVSDTGVGIPPARLATLFTAEGRTSTTGTAGEGGTGLGLLVCDEFVRRMGSRLTVESQPGGGTTFAFALPAA